MCPCLTHLRDLLYLDKNQQRSCCQRHLSMRILHRQGLTMTTLPLWTFLGNLHCPNEGHERRESSDSTPDTSPLETPDGMLVYLPLLMPNIAPSVMNPGMKRKEPDTEPPTRLKSPSPVMWTSSPDIPDLFLVSPKTLPSYNPPVSFLSSASLTIRSQLFSSHSHSHSPPSPPPTMSKSLPEMKFERNLNSVQQQRKMTLDDGKKEREKMKVGAIKREEEVLLRIASLLIPVPRAPRAMTIPGALWTPKE
ncbi:hypothetical protein EV421DRAFT_382348 [Armillaria borealis]|uniref:Uncharacterized protein n=1 Tax=Armillaria borealis TaxID=47425 RepID=A0AA39IT00_9AGAR|nr:hypothetical protein EV421DRAFT_382348 [Armillaria borealis]